MDLIFSDTNSFGGESSNSEDQDDVEFLYGGQACSVLSSLEETLGKIDDFLSFGRAFIHGDIVCSVKDPTGQMGKVIDVDIVVDLENMYGRKIRDVNSKDLERIRSISVGDYVVNGAWLGKVEKIDDRVTVLFHDGTMSDFTMSGSEKLIPTSPDLLEDSQYPFYPGQKVQVKSSYVPNSAGWFCGMRKNNKNHGTVCSVDAGLVYVSWLGCALISRENVFAPPALQDSRSLSLLSCFPYENWQFGDWCLFQAPQKEKSRVPEIANIVKITTKVDVLWQDGSYSLGLDSDCLISISVIDPHDFWPGQIVLEKEMYGDDLSLSIIHKWGVVKYVDAKERTVNVEWNAVWSHQPANVKLQQTEEERVSSAYELTEHPEFSYCFGDAVFRLTCKRDTTSTGTDDLCSADDYLHCNLLSNIGVVIGLKDGDVEVKWASGFQEKVAPYEIYRVEKCEGSTMPIIASAAEQMNEERPEQDYQLSEQRGKEKTRRKVPCEEVENIFGSSSCSIPQAAIGLLTRIGSSLFDSLTTSVHGVYKHLSEDGEFQNEEAVEIHKMPGDAPPVTVHLEEVMDTNVEPATNEAEIGKEHGLQDGSMRHEHFRQFDMVNDCSDHYFANAIGSILGSSQINRTWLKKVQQEWTILERDLPETIYVSIYEERMDLLRAAIVGPQGTPYHDGLFFFDIILPPEYPNEPPMVYYNSGGLRVNPNLYESGKVCLSLLNTWTGSGSEVWNPKSSTILQVLLSLQALVLNEKPYFNEAGYDLQIGNAEGEKNSISYNENAYLVTCKSMLYLLRKPPKHFEALIEQHFSHCGEHILRACMAYMEGSPIGAAFTDNEMDQESFNKSSTGFKIMLRKLFPRLVEAFTAKGIDCSHLSDLDSKHSP